MKLHQLRNATIVLEFGQRRLLVDPCLGSKGSFPGFKLLGGGRSRNPLVDLPDEAEGILEEVTDVLITHAQHADHLDHAGVAWIKAQGLPLWCSAPDLHPLRKKGLRPQEVVNGSMGMGIKHLPQKHGRGPIGWMMGPVAGFFLAPEDQPSVLLTSDAVLNDALLADVAHLCPDLIVVPAGSANLGWGPDILFSVDELIALAKASQGQLVFNHLEALDHCPTRRVNLRQRLKTEGLLERTHVPEDGETLSFESADSVPWPRDVILTGSSAPRPILQKWVADTLGRALS